MMLLFLSTILKSLLQLLPIKSGFGIPKIDKNYSEYKFQGSNAIQLLFHMMVRVLYLDGLMEKSEYFYRNQVNFYMSSMTPIIMDVPLLQ